MNRSRITWIATLCLMIVAAAIWTRSGRAADVGKRAGDGGIEVAIALPHSPFQQEIYVDIRQDMHFPVVITNTSNKPINFLDANNSWGDVALSFDAVDEHGMHYSIKKQPKAWLDNGETFWILQPGEHLVIDVCFGERLGDRDRWKGFPDMSDAKSSKVTLTARWENTVDKGADGVRSPLWHGRCESKPLDCRLRDLRK